VAHSKNRDEARATAYRLLGCAFHYPADVDWELFGNGFRSLMPEVAKELGLQIDDELKELTRIWPERLDNLFLHEHTELFINSPHGILAPLNESLYFGHERQVCTARTQSVAEAYSKAGFSPAESMRHLLPDHLSLELEFMALCLLQRIEVSAYFNTHIYSWQPRLAHKIIATGRSEFYSHIARTLLCFLDAENSLINGSPSKLGDNMAV
jgi:TorA maturation chaperone TorD